MITASTVAEKFDEKPRITGGTFVAPWERVRVRLRAEWEATMIQDILEPNWESHVGQDIGGPTDPITHKFIPPDLYIATLSGDVTQFYIKGKPFTCWLAANHRPLLPNTGGLTLSLELMTDRNTLDVCQEIEIDTRISSGGWDFNHSFRINYLRGGILQISDGTLPTAKWLDTGIVYGKLDPRCWYRLSLDYSFDVIGQTYRTTRITINDEWWDLSQSAWKSQKLGWSDGAHLQVQQDLNGAGGWFNIYTRNMTYTWK